MADDQNVRRPKAIVLFQTMIEQLEAEDVDNDEDQQPDKASFDECCFRGGGHEMFRTEDR